ncbi:MAG: peptidase domain-containing ABC transporter [Myxococcales bacterium]|nr:peptidase domain-containing ABC transporter [Myxococcales bacterium]
MRTKVRVIQQMEAAECGLACLSMVLDYHGHECSLSELRHAFGSSRNGHSALELLKAARSLGLEGRGLSVPCGSLGALRGPAILHWNLNHFVVLEGVDPHGVRIVDPADGRRTVSIAEVSEQFSGVVLELQPGPSFEKRRRKSLSMGRYVEALKAQRRALLFVVAANIVQHILAVALPATNQLLIDHVVQPHRSDWLVPVVLVLCGATVAQVALQRLHGFSQAILHGSLGMTLALEMGNRLLRLPIPFLESRSHGDLIERVNMQGELQGLLAQTVQALFDMFLVVLLITLMLTYNPFLGAVSLALTVARIAVVRWFRRPIGQRMAAELAARGREAGALSESTSAIEMTKGFGVERHVKDRYAAAVRERVKWNVGSERLETGLAEAMGVVDATMLATILWFGGQQVIAGSMTIGVFAGFLTIRAMVEAPMGSIVSLVESWLRVRGILERCDDILTQPLPEQVRPQTCTARATVGRIDVEDLGFRFGNGPWIFRHLNLTIEPGEHVVITGPSGRGKSTFLKVVCGLLQPTEGRVLLDGCDVRAYDPGTLAQSCGVVLQEPLILDSSVRDAIAIRDPDCGEGEVQEAAHVACFHEVVQGLADGYASRLEAMGRNLSGGERQRLAIAQAVLKRPPLILLDEGTCSLDRALEGRVIGNILNLRRTVISIAHRESVVRHADRVITLDDDAPQPALADVPARPSACEGVREAV